MNSRCRKLKLKDNNCREMYWETNKRATSRHPLSRKTNSIVPNYHFPNKSIELEMDLNVIKMEVR